MKKVENPNTYLKWNGRLVEVIGICEGRTIHMRPVDEKPCKTCGEIKEYHSLEHSPQFQNEAEPLDTIQLN